MAAESFGRVIIALIKFFDQDITEFSSYFLYM